MSNKDYHVDPSKDHSDTFDFEYFCHYFGIKTDLSNSMLTEEDRIAFINLLHEAEEFEKRYYAKYIRNKIN